MVATTTLMDYERNKSTLDEDVDYVLSEARKLTNKDWQVRVTVHRKKRWFVKIKCLKRGNCSFTWAAAFLGKC